MTYDRGDVERLRNDVEGRDVLYSERFVFEVGCNLTPSGIRRRARFEWSERKDGVAAEG